MPIYGRMCRHVGPCLIWLPTPHQCRRYVIEPTHTPIPVWCICNTVTSLGPVIARTTANELQGKGPVIRCNFSCNLHRNSTVKRCEICQVRLYESSSDFPNEFFTNQTVFTNHMSWMQNCVASCKKNCIV
jgi:hypothetical protein